MYTISGYEHIKSKEGQVFTKVYISQRISDERGFKPFPLNYLVTGEIKTFVPGLECVPVLDAKTDGTLFISSLNLVEGDVVSGSVVI